MPIIDDTIIVHPTILAEVRSYHPAGATAKNGSPILRITPIEDLI
jgi:hypothetical protein